MIRLLLVDDHPFYRDGIREMLAGHPEVEVVAEAATGEEALAAADEHAIDIAVMDLALPGMTGLETTRELTARHPELIVLVLSMHGDDEAVMAAIRAGATGYLMKDIGVTQLVSALRALHDGHEVFSPGLLRPLTAKPIAPAASRAFPELTGRELDVLDLLAGDLDTASIARQLGLSGKTVYNYVATILAKLGARDRAEAARRARDAGLGTDPGRR